MFAKKKKVPFFCGGAIENVHWRLTLKQQRKVLLGLGKMQVRTSQVLVYLNPGEANLSSVSFLLCQESLCARGNKLSCRDAFYSLWHELGRSSLWPTIGCP